MRFPGLKTQVGSMAAAPGRNFLQVAVQDCSRAPLQPGDELALSVFALLDVAADKSGGGSQLWR
ncbi:MAG: hypothetical protein EBT03_13310, partial [Betaproteobacteria bacterium]|nr:hypothetical protein [Betaproteobacteria bacterium]